MNASDATRRLAIVGGIDPAATSGLVALAVDAERPNERDRWRWIDARVVNRSTRNTRSAMEDRLSLYTAIASQLAAWRVTDVAIERPSDNIPRGWKSKGQSGGAQSAETAFSMGEAVGMAAAGALAAGARVTSYPVTSSREKRTPGRRIKPARVGWMPMVVSGHLWHVQSREITLDALHKRSLDIRSRPHNGVLAPDRLVRLDENILMALGVLEFHLLRCPPL